ncbi:hypothetical protein [Microbacterium sp. G2-8]|uniref:hypothetical protein n=1 Tax=Microbacterium sp. G2-8 TaxID=2842454 RepID=UPI001C8A3F74|nr:hypothetical protein [Microbacterium sp. G2-8]
MADLAQLDDLKKTLAADDYHLDYEPSEGRAHVTIIAGPAACDECLVPKPLMKTMLAPMLGIGADDIDLSYPTDV